MSQTFKLGDEVRWGSQAAGSRTSKYGKIVAVIPAGESPNPYAQQAAETHQALLKLPFELPRYHESYLVLVQRYGKRGWVKPQLYWPRVSALGLQSKPFRGVY
jgi:hypothetical protein